MGHSRRHVWENSGLSRSWPGSSASSRQGTESATNDWASLVVSRSQNDIGTPVAHSDEPRLPASMVPARHQLTARTPLPDALLPAIGLGFPEMVGERVAQGWRRAAKRNAIKIAAL